MLKKIKAALEKEKEGLKFIKNKQDINGVTREWMSVKLGRKKLKSPSKLIQWLRDDTLAFVDEEVLYRAMEEGKAIHSNLALCDIMGQTLKDKDNLPLEKISKNYLSLKDKLGIEVLENELHCFSKELQLHGYIDKVAVIKDQPYIIDIKTKKTTNNLFRTYNATQVYIYKMILDKVTGMDFQVGIIEVNREDGIVEWLDLSKTKDPQYQKVMDFANKVNDIYCDIEDIKKIIKDNQKKGNDWKDMNFDIFGGEK